MTQLNSASVHVSAPAQYLCSVILDEEEGLQNQGRIVAVALSQNADFVALGYAKGRVEVWKLDGKFVPLFCLRVVHHGAIQALAWHGSFDNVLFIGASNGILHKVIVKRSGDEFHAAFLLEGFIHALGMDRDGEDRLAVASENNVGYVSNAVAFALNPDVVDVDWIYTHKPVVVKNPLDEPNPCDITLQGDLIYVAHIGSIGIRIFSISQKKLVMQIPKGSEPGLRPLYAGGRFSPSLKYAVMCRFGAPIVDWYCLKTGVLLSTSKQCVHKDMTYWNTAIGLSFLDDETVLSGSMDGATIVWKFQPFFRPLLLRDYADSTGELQFMATAKDRNGELWQVICDNQFADLKSGECRSTRVQLRRLRVVPEGHPLIESTKATVLLGQRTVQEQVMETSAEFVLRDVAPISQNPPSASAPTPTFVTVPTPEAAPSSQQLRPPSTQRPPSVADRRPVLDRVSALKSLPRSSLPAVANAQERHTSPPPLVPPLSPRLPPQTTYVNAFSTETQAGQTTSSSTIPTTHESGPFYVDPIPNTNNNPAPSISMAGGYNRRENPTTPTPQRRRGKTNLDGSESDGDAPELDVKLTPFSGFIKSICDHNGITVRSKATLKRNEVLEVDGDPGAAFYTPTVADPSDHDTQFFTPTADLAPSTPPLPVLCLSQERSTLLEHARRARDPLDSQMSDDGDGDGDSMGSFYIPANAGADANEFSGTNHGDPFEDDNYFSMPRSGANAEPRSDRSISPMSVPEEEADLEEGGNLEELSDDEEIPPPYPGHESSPLPSETHATPVQEHSRAVTRAALDRSTTHSPSAMDWGAPISPQPFVFAMPGSFRSTPRMQPIPGHIRMNNPDTTIPHNPAFSGHSVLTTHHDILDSMGRRHRVPVTIGVRFGEPTSQGS